MSRATPENEAMTAAQLRGQARVSSSASWSVPPT